MYKIKLNDGTELTNLELNGNNYISETVIEDSTFKDNLETVVISDGQTVETHKDMVLVSNQVRDGHSWFILGEKTSQQKALDKIMSTLASNTNSITDVQMALAEVYELVTTGGN